LGAVSPRTLRAVLKICERSVVACSIPGVSRLLIDAFPGVCHDDTVTCVFCSIVAGSGPADIVFEDADCLAFLCIAPATPGHTLVVPRLHTEDIWSVDSSTYAAVAQATHAVCDLVRQRLDPEGLTLIQTNRVAGWQSVFHLHVQVVPRYLGDGLVEPWTEVPVSRAELGPIGDLLGARKQR